MKRKWNWNMDLYFLSYDLRNKRDYQTLYDELEKYQAKAVLESVWCFTKDNTTTAELRDHFGKYIDSDDGLLVIKSSSWASRGAKATPKDL